MVVDNLSNAHLYYGMGSRIAAALKFLQQSDLESMGTGKYEIDGSNVYAMVQEYRSKPLEEGKWEAHRRYIDIQYVVKGNEKMGYASLRRLNVVQEYNAESDYLLLEGNGDFITFTPGNFAVFGPEDAHAPGIAAAKPDYVKKVVVKVLV